MVIVYLYISNSYFHLSKKKKKKCNKLYNLIIVDKKKNS